jgi:hypothetical protein
VLSWRTTARSLKAASPQQRDEVGEANPSIAITRTGSQIVRMRNVTTGGRLYYLYRARLQRGC